MKQLSKIERAILLLAECLEDPDHDQYAVYSQVMEILELKEEDIVKKDIPICPVCGEDMVEAFDEVAKKYTGHQWKCKCNPEAILSIG